MLFFIEIFASIVVCSHTFKFRDYTKESDFDDSCGYWYCIPHPDDPEEKTRLFYSVQVSMFDWVPAFVVDFMSKKALTDATAWVKKFSEAEWAKAKKDGTATKPTGTSSQPKREPIFALPFGKRKREEEERLAREAAEQLALEQQAEAEKRRSLVSIRAGWRRYALVSMVLVLAAYNVVMFFGDNHDKTQ